MSKTQFNMNSQQARVARYIKTYSSQGVHRTGTETDNQSAGWLLNEMKDLGAKPAFSDFQFQRVEVKRAQLHLNDTSVPGVPLYDGSFTNDEGVVGQLGEIGSKADIGVVINPPVPSQSLIDARTRLAHKAILIVTDERFPATGPAIQNAENFNSPFGPPALQVGNHHWQQIQQAMAQGSKARLIAHAHHVPALAKNVVARLPGSNPELSPLVIMTPRSAWWQCAAERGGGIAAFLEIMRAVIEAGHQRTVMCTANTGHELSHIGLDDYLQKHPGLLQSAHLWIHLGANFAASQSPGIRLQYSDSDAKQAMESILDQLALKPFVETPLGDRPLGEARNVFDGNGRYISILGAGNNLFHHPDDLYPEAIDIKVTTAWVEAMAQLAVKLANA